MSIISQGYGDQGAIVTQGYGAGIFEAVITLVVGLATALKRGKAAGSDKRSNLSFIKKRSNTPFEKVG